MQVFQADGVRLGVSKVYGGVDHSATLAGCFGTAFNNDLIVEIESKALRILASVAIVHAHAEFVIAGGGRCEGASPADRVVVPLQAGDGDDLVPIEIDIAISAFEHRLPGEILRIEVLASEAVAGAASGMERCVLDRHRQSLDEAGALGVRNLRAGEALFDPGERINGGRWGAVVVALQGLNEFCGWTDDGNVAYTGF